jgi:hypothetical protein
VSRGALEEEEEARRRRRKRRVSRGEAVVSDELGPVLR